MEADEWTGAAAEGSKDDWRVEWEHCAAERAANLAVWAMRVKTAAWSAPGNAKELLAHWSTVLEYLATATLEVYVLTRDGVFLPNLMQRIAANLAAAEPPNATPGERLSLTWYVSQPTKTYWWPADGEPRTLGVRGPARRPHLAARGLWRILMGETQIRRCPAPEPGHSDPKRKCGRYFVSGGKIGRPAIFCSDACSKRASRVRKKVRKREGCEET